VIKELLSYCFKKDLNIVDSRNITTGWTPLIRACYKGYADVAKLLLDYNADIEAKGKKGFTALIAASQVGHKIALFSVFVMPD
jgi:ankyrin repeat protein